MAGAANQAMNTTTYCSGTSSANCELTQKTIGGSGGITWTFGHAFDHQIASATCSDSTQTATPVDQNDNLAF